MKRNVKFIALLMLFLLPMILLTGCSDKSEEKKENTSNLNEHKKYEYYFNTDIPTLESVYGYKKPAITTGSYNETGEYYAAYTSTNIDEYNSDVKEQDFTDYKKILNSNGYIETEKNILKKDNIEVYIEYGDKSFSIRIKNINFKQD